MLVGAGTLEFRLLNMRTPLRFALLRNGLELPVVAAWSAPLAPAVPNAPTQGHLALTAREG